MWRRILITAFLAGWPVYEFTMGSPYWGAFFVVGAAICIYYFFYLDFPEDEEKK